MEKKKNTPKLRFPEFTGEWEEKKLGEIADVKTGPFGSILHQHDYVSIGTPIITVEHLDELGIVHKNLPLVSEEDKKRLKSYLLEEGDIVFSRVGSVDRNSLIGPNENGWLFSGRLLRIRFDKEQSTPKFYNIFFQKEESKQKVRSIAVGQTMPSINTEILKSIEIKFPTLPEQTKIATFLTAVDEKLIQLKKKKTFLEQYKKGVMQKLFSQELRFKDNNNQDFPDWQEKTLGDVASIRSGLSKNQNGNTDGIKVTRIETISDGTINTERIGYIDMNVGLEEYKLLKGDILFSNINSVSHIGKTAIAFCDLDLYHGMNLLCIRTRKSFDSFFLFYYLNLESIRCYFKSVCNQAVSQASINQTELAKTILTTPSLPEQQKIAKLLLSIDDKIDYCGKQIVRMESWKKGLLQQMFI